ncbi:transcription elongation factor-like protein [Leptomonas pyrrhocoris]|uniref:Transcription elongation factor-like protein n=1 Tax=Leptomonas pyrrhocoris TaxID=157538 RepID=A0A0M9FZ14_LEPPY|nr:transcription elongation factor-like protein [Leptomonas pyrrhocoris]KPA79015.1 transcription elongation factor-like protein [Leptomonas pyrrhocoris]|eukprot:XP_015657454.1 transcription elongation factor-like protein [Leptomonas pyrrhocoris]
MSGSDWDSDSDVSDSHEIASAMNMCFVEHLAQQHAPRVTQRRRSRSPAGPEANRSVREVVDADGTPRTQPRLDVVAMIGNALKKGDVRGLPAEMSVEQLSAQIVEALRRSSGGGEVARAVTQALADPLNTDLRNAVLKGEMSPEKLVTLDELSLLNPKERAIREKARLDRLNQHSVDYLEKLSLTVTHMYTCPVCGSQDCFANFRSTDFVKWQGDDQTPTLLRCCKCAHSFRQ